MDICKSSLSKWCINSFKLQELWQDSQTTKLSRQSLLLEDCEAFWKVIHKDFLGQLSCWSNPNQSFLSPLADFNSSSEDEQAILLTDLNSSCKQFIIQHSHQQYRDTAGKTGRVFTPLWCGRQAWNGNTLKRAWEMIYNLRPAQIFRKKSYSKCSIKFGLRPHQ